MLASSITWCVACGELRLGLCERGGKVDRIGERRESRHERAEPGDAVRRERRQIEPGFIAAVGEQNAGATRRGHDRDPPSSRQLARAKRLRGVDQVVDFTHFDETTLGEGVAVEVVVFGEIRGVRHGGAAAGAWYCRPSTRRSACPLRAPACRARAAAARRSGPRDRSRSGARSSSARKCSTKSSVPRPASLPVETT